jgi:hypothetical protein
MESIRQGRLGLGQFWGAGLTVAETSEICSQIQCASGNWLHVDPCFLQFLALEKWSAQNAEGAKTILTSTLATRQVSHRPATFCRVNGALAHPFGFLFVSLWPMSLVDLSANHLSSLQVVLKRRLNELVNEQVWILHGSW